MIKAPAVRAMAREGRRMVKRNPEGVSVPEPAGRAALGKTSGRVVGELGTSGRSQKSC